MDPLVPENFKSHGWIYRYLTMMNQTTEAPWIYNIAGGLAALGAMYGRRLRIPFGNHEINANMAVMWVGPSAIGKSESMNTCLKVIKHAWPATLVIADQATPAGLLATVSLGADEVEEADQRGDVIKDTEWILAASEMATLVNASSHNDGMIPLLTDILDNKPEVRKTTKGGGTDVVVRPTMTGLMCSTVNWMHEMMPAGLFEGGFMRRFMIAAAFEKEKFIPLPRTLDAKELAGVATELRKLRTMMPWASFELTPGSLLGRAYEVWVRQLHEEAKDTDPKLQGLYGHMHVHVLRISMLLAVSRFWARLEGLQGRRPDGLEQPQINLADFSLATRIMGQVVPAVEVVLSTRVGKDFAGMRQQVLDLVRKSKRSGISLPQLLARVPCRPREMDEILESLVGARLIKNGTPTKESPDPRYYDVKWRRLT